MSGVEVKMSVKVMLVDNHVIVREGISKLLENDNVEIVSEASSGEECLEKLDKVKPHVLIIDINLPDRDGFQVVEEIRRKYNSLKIIVLTNESRVNIIKRAMELGVKGFLTKECTTFELKKAIYRVCNDENYIQSNLTSRINDKSLTRTADKNKINSLTNRELEVLIQIANGMFNKEIAILLNISERTVKNHVSNIFKKIGVSDRTQAAVFAIKNNLINIE